MSWVATIITLYPDMFPGMLGHSLAGRALTDGIWSCNARNIRDWATDKHRTVDDTPAGGGPGGPSSRGGRGSPSGNPEQDSLRAAIMDKLPDAEVKSRLERLREVRKQNEAKVSKAQEELRAVLSVRQEAVAVMFGLLP